MSETSAVGSAKRTLDDADEPIVKAPRIEAATSFSHVRVDPDAEEPVSVSFADLPLRDPAKVYEFTLDQFQREAVLCLERQESVMVSAHTSAGKTAIGEYAIALAMRNKQRVLYTSPIKALSNQKFREFKAEFGDVGLMTGDNSLAPNASCLVMTTEILRNMLFRGSEVMREVGYVVFDECHFMRDVERGVVWEESIILLPPTVTLVFLSATIANAVEFAQWVSSLKRKPCHVICTDFRPTPLQHFVFPQSGDGLYLVKDGANPFRFDRFEELLRFANSTQSADQSRSSSGVGDTVSKSDMRRIVQLLVAGEYNPAIFFSFSRAECEAMALQLGSMSLTSEDERAGIELVWQNGIEGLSEADRSLSQITSMLPLLKRGIGVHHSGLLPILKELVEILFSEGLIKILFATETFAMGINMPAKTVVFTNIMKFDGKVYRCMTANEYIQMSGRAGRRGIDSRGTCILMLDASQAVAEEVAAMVGGPPAPLTSQFRLSYHTLLNLLRLARADVDVDDAGKILERSFYFFQRHRQLPRMRQKLIELESKLAVAPTINDDLLPRVSSMSELLTLQAQLYATLRPVLLWPSVCLPLLQPGRVVLVRAPRSSSNAPTDATSAERLEDQVTDADVDEALQSSDSDSDTDQSSDEERRRIRAARSAARRSHWAHGVVVGLARRFVGNSADALTIDVLLPCQVQRVGSTVIPAVSTPGNLSFEIVRVGLSMLEQITAVRLYMSAFSDLRVPEARSACYQSMTDALKTFGDNVPIVEPTVELLKHLLSDVPAVTSTTSPSQLLFQSPTLAALETLPGVMNRLSIVRQQLSVHSLSSEPRRAELCAVYQHSMKLQQRASRLKSIIRFHTATGLFETEFKARSRVLRRLCHIDDDGLLLAKGRVAAEIEAVDELVVTELIFEGVFNRLDVPSTAATVACMLDCERASKSPPLSPALNECLTIVQAAARRVADVCLQSGVATALDPTTAASRFKPQLMPLIYAWCSGDAFTDICDRTTLFEGTLTRNIRRLGEVLRQMADASRAIGNEELEKKFEDTITSLTRGLPFAASLYV